MEKERGETLFVLLVLSSVLVTFSNIASVRAADDSWETMAEMPTASYALGVGVVDGKLFAIGGSNGV